MIQQLQPTEMNKVNISDSDMSVLHQGFYQVAHGTSGLTNWTCLFNGALVSISGKRVQPKAMCRWSASNQYQCGSLCTIRYPQIAVAVVFPHNTNLTNGVGPSIARDIINLYQKYHPMN